MKAQLEQVGIFNGTSSLTNFEVQNYYQNEPKFNGVYSRNNLPKIKDGAYVINLDEYESIGTHWIAFIWCQSKIVWHLKNKHIKYKIDDSVLKMMMEHWNVTMTYTLTLQITLVVWIS